MTADAARAYSYIRLSTEGQLKGHGRDRQVQQSADFAKRHGLRLATDSQLEDFGISAFKGANVKEGALGKFLEAVEAGLVPKGSFLLVESLDRVSRQAILESLSLFLRIIRAGINLVTLQDEHVYRADQTDFSDLIISLTIMMRAHEESLTKSRRVGAAWANKRARATVAPLTSWCPAWLRLSSDRTHFEPIPQRAASIRSIFEEAAAGIGILKISRRLNHNNVPVMGKSKGWHPSYVAKILSNPAVIGEYQPCQVIGGKRTPIGDPIPNYYPPVIENELYYRVQQSKKDRRINGRGRKGLFFTNIFSGIATCIYCHRPMVFENKGPGPKGGTFLVCEAAKRGLNCDSTRWRYEQFEASFLAFVEQLTLSEIVYNQDTAKRSVDDAIQALRGRLSAVEAEQQKARQVLQRDPNLEFVTKLFRELQDEGDSIRAQLANKESDRAQLDAAVDELYRSKEEIKSLIARLQTPGENDLYKLRSQVADRIKGLIETLQIAPAGQAPKVAKAIEMLDGQGTNVPDRQAIIETMKIDQDMRYFLVGFKNGDVLGVYPKRDNPLEFERRVDVSKVDVLGEQQGFWQLSFGTPGVHD